MSSVLLGYPSPPPAMIPPSLWDDDHVYVREDGYLLLRSRDAADPNNSQQEHDQQKTPLLLHSAEVFLKELYPSNNSHKKSLDEILALSPVPLSEQEDVVALAADHEATVKTVTTAMEKMTVRGRDDDDDDDDQDEGDNEEEDPPDETVSMIVDDGDGDDHPTASPSSVDDGPAVPHAVEETPTTAASKSSPKGNHKNHNNSGTNQNAKKTKGKGKNGPEEQQQEQEADTQYQKVYQRLKRCNNLANRIPPLIMDIQSFRHRSPTDQKRNYKNHGRSSREASKVRALEQQQRHLLKTQNSSSSNNNNSTSGTNHKNKSTTDDDGGPDDAAVGTEEYNDNDNEDPNGSSPKESHTVRMVRTLNSIRAVYPHLFQIFNHKRRNDRNLKIGSVEWQGKKRGFCWILGTNVFDTTSSKVIINAHKDATLILQGLIPIDIAQQICQDPQGGSQTEFWSKAWIPHVQARASPRMEDPLTVLAGCPGAPSREAILEKVQRCDEQLHLDSSDLHDEQLQAAYDAAVQKVHKTISQILTNRFPKARISIYGSCLSNLSLGKGADVDLSLWLPEADKLQTDFQEGKVDAAKYEKQMKQFVYQVFHKLHNRGNEFQDMQPITRARVPVVKGTYNFAHNPYSADGSINFDICFLNDIAVANSGLLREYSLVDPRVRKLMMAVKLWAKEHRINSAKDNSISSYAWINLVIFYLQCVGFVPNLQSADLMKAVGFVPDPQGNIWHSVRKLDTWYLTWAQVVESENAWTIAPGLSEVSVSALLYGFFEFYSRRFPGGNFAVSIKSGSVRLPKMASNKARLFFSIEDPFETFDSHCPHDLGSPAADSGTRDMMECFHKAERHLREILLGKSRKEKLWPNHVTASGRPASKVLDSIMIPNVKRLEKHSTDEKKSAGNHHDGDKDDPGMNFGQGQGQKNRGGRGRNRNGRGGQQGGRGPPPKPNLPPHPPSEAPAHHPKKKVGGPQGPNKPHPKKIGGPQGPKKQQNNTSKTDVSANKNRKGAVANITETKMSPEPNTEASAKNKKVPKPKNLNAKDHNDGTNVSNPTSGGDGDKNPKGPGHGKPKTRKRRHKPPAKETGTSPE